MARTVVLSINASWNVFNFRRGLVAALREAGWHVVVLAPADEYAPRLAEMGVEHVPIAIDSASLSPARDLALLAGYYRRLARIRPDIFLGFTAKPNVYGSLAAQALGIPVINNISGLGTAFMKSGPLRWIVERLYRVALRRSAIIFFQNEEDRRLFLDSGLVRPQQARLLAGSGVDLARFAPASGRERPPGPFTFLLVGRLLWQKGVAEYVEAARLVRREVPDARFQLLGFLEAANVSAVGRADVGGWQSEGLIDYLGQVDDVRPLVAAADCLVLPSYREGLPRSLLEGAALAKPLIASDVPGCRQVVEHGVNGLLCEVRNARSLADAMLAMLRLDEEARRAMGAAGRKRVERDYAEERVIGAYRDAIDEKLAAVGPVNRR
ncbi:glycosyltransferase family 4 protein [Sphingosinicella sp. CPCC 101087]|uniref:glycosyltransferase family 4 protein n=1 Tax=Sphingosinicella sp. CPCC 101087 TaxID=2497754 RepID=UPI00101DA1E3|nr:glycosyltransferase family 4 protein [Sphingosinicella sp. CPCC 101087]